MTTLHRLTWTLDDDAGNPIEKVRYYEVGDERFIRRDVNGYRKDPRVKNLVLRSTVVDWVDTEAMILDVGPCDFYGNPLSVADWGGRLS